ncbi:MAG: glycosyltransferase [bacterium]
MISIVIRVKNEIDTLPLLIESLKNQTYKNYEIIVVDNESTDGTFEYASAHADTVVTITSKEFSHAKSTNLGIQQAKGKYVYITNGRSMPTSIFMLETAKRILDKNYKVAGIFGNVKVHKDKKRRNYTELWFDNLTYLLLSRKYKEIQRFYPGLLQTISCMIRTDLAKEYPYEEMASKGGEDILFGLKMINKGYKVAFHPDLNVYHSHGGKNLNTINRYLSYSKMAREAIIKSSGKTPIPTRIIKTTKKIITSL